MDERTPAMICQRERGRERGRGKPSSNSVSFPHFSKVFHEFPYTGIPNFDLVNINREQGKTSTTE
jgi:hypothetical protein